LSSENITFGEENLEEKNKVEEKLMVNKYFFINVNFILCRSQFGYT
jgi:hypothetical protein